MLNKLRGNIQASALWCPALLRRELQRRRDSGANIGDLSRTFAASFSTPLAFFWAESAGRHRLLEF